jgi:hypothetical protein
MHESGFKRILSVVIWKINIPSKTWTKDILNSQMVKIQSKSMSEKEGDSLLWTWSDVLSFK